MTGYIRRLCVMFQIDAITRIEYSESISALLEFGISLNETYPSVYPFSPFTIYSPDYLTIAFNVCIFAVSDVQTMENLSLRQSVARSVSAMFRIDPNETLPFLASLARDMEACSHLWTPSILASNESVDTLKTSITRVLHQYGADMALVYYNSLNDYVSVIANPLHHT